MHGGAEAEDEPIEDDGEKFLQDDEDAAAEAAGAISAGVSDLALVDEMLEIAKKHAHRPDVRIAWLADWVRTNMAPDGRWNGRRLVLFTEYEDTRRWVEKRLAEALDDLDADDRVYRRDAVDPPRGVEATLQLGSRTRSLAHPHLHGRRTRRHQSPDAMPRLDPH